MSEFYKLNPSLKIAVTGGSGFLGKEIISMLLNIGCEDIISIARKPQHHYSKSKIKSQSADISDYKSFSKYFKGVDVVFHTAAKASIWGKYKDFYNINTIGTENIIKACIENNVPVLVYTSSPSVVSSASNLENVNENIPYPEKFFSFYAKTKALAEDKILTQSPSLRTIALRPHLIWGPDDPHILPRIIKKSHAGKLLRVGEGSNIVDLTYIKNAAFAHLLAAETLLSSKKLSGKAYFITDDSPVNLWDWINNFLLQIGMQKINKSISEKNALIAGKLFEIFYSLFNLSSEPPITVFSALQLSHSHYFDISAAKKDLGYHTIIKPDDALQNTVDFFKSKLP